MNSIEKRRQNDLAGLLFVHYFGWLRAIELGALLFPKNATSAEAANRIIRGWDQRRLVIVRELPDRAGKAIVLATAGVRFLSENGHKSSSGKDLGSTAAGVWKPPASWRHDLIAAGVLGELRKQGYGVVPETELRRRSNDCPKLPDGLLKGLDGQWIWLEVEHARKTGRHLQDLGKAIALAATGEIKSIAGCNATAALVAYVENEDEREYAIDHRSRVLKAISEYAPKPLKVALAHCTLKGAGIASLTITEVVVEPKRALAVLRVLNAGKWLQLENGIQQGHYGSHRASVWPIEPGLWGYQVDELPGDYAGTIKEAKQHCARAIAEML